MLTRLNKGEEVWIVCFVDSTIQGDNSPGIEDAEDYHSHFSGYPVSAHNMKDYLPSNVLNCIRLILLYIAANIN